MEPDLHYEAVEEAKHVITMFLGSENELPALHWLDGTGRPAGRDGPRAVCRLALRGLWRNS
jgi:hypothetical protein